MNRKRLLALTTPVAIVLSVYSYVRWQSNDFPHVERGPQPTSGIPPTGATLREANLDHWLPPPPKDAMPYEVRAPLFNGSDVVEKRRWLWVPKGTEIQVFSTSSGLRVDVPTGTMLWKEFWVRGEGAPQLVERRVMKRVNDSEGFEGWQFYKAHHLPERPRHDMNVGFIEAKAFNMAPNSWHPTQPALRAISVSLGIEAGLPREYVFPGRSQCVNCHGGAAGCYATGSNALVFGLSDLLANQESRTEMLRRQWLKQDSIWDQESRASEGLTGETDRLVGLLRTNCLSCHNSSKNAMARRSGFVLDPQKRYSPVALAQALRQRGVMMGADTQPILNLERLSDSEILMRLEGRSGRRRMPPREGGVATKHEELIHAIKQWAEHTRESSGPPVRSISIATAKLNATGPGN